MEEVLKLDYDTTNIVKDIVGATGSVVTGAQLTAEFRPCFEIKSANYMVWYDFAVSELPHLFENLGKMGLARGFDATRRVWVNTATVNVTVGYPELTNVNYVLIPEKNTFSNTYPLMINYGLYINKPPSTSYASGISGSVSSCKLSALLFSNGCRPSKIIILCRFKQKYKLFVLICISTYKKDHYLINL